MTDLLNTPVSEQNLDGTAVLSVDSLNALRLRIVEDDYDPTAEEMAAAVQSIRPERKLASEKKPKKASAAKKETIKKKAAALDLSDLMP